MRRGVHFEGYFEVNEVEVWIGAINHAKNHPFPQPSFRTALPKPRNLSSFPLKIRSRPKKGENGQGYGPSALIPGSQKPTGSEKTPPRRQLQISARKCINLLELRPSKNTVTPVDRVAEKVSDRLSSQVSGTNKRQHHLIRWKQSPVGAQRIASCIPLH